ncbi:MAG: AbrB/MazE/SpoVT family DNA-binding domain-containing protein [Candidatus Marinimicrobia bacterium]|nr:AbrB/MazE/SpoVT family DNA-binding domain-containing protein [Candidatus Neomarinimicrobiota bacterium]
MKAQIIRIGNSRGIRIPKVVIEQCQFDNEVDLEVNNQKLIISSAEHPRVNWDNQFRTMADNQDDRLLISDSSLTTTWDEEEWDW